VRELHIQRFDGLAVILIGGCAPDPGGPEGELVGAISTFARAYALP
jgi:hypothetical protein